jgi:MHS family proline/betaine transporter-like MFS transporter
LRAHFGWFKRRHEITISDVTVIDRPTLNRAVAAAALGNAMEWFDFGVYGYLAVTLGQVFFPGGKPAIQLIAALAAFTAAFVVRPLGGIVLGPLGDRYGRHKVLAMTMVMMAIGTFSIGLILLCPDRHGRPGAAALRKAGAGLFDRRRIWRRGDLRGRIFHRPPQGLMGSWLEFGTFGGYIAGAALVTGLQMSLGADAMLAWGWRVPFLIAGPLGLLGLYMRMKLEETPAFKAYTDEAENRETVRLRDMISAHWRQLVKCVALVLVFNVTDYMLLTYMPNYLSVTLGYAESKGLLLIILVMLVLMPLNVLGGVFADRLGRRPMVIGACAALIVLAIPCMMLIGTGNDALIFLGLMVLGITLVCFTSTMPSTLPALFYTPVRYSALSIAFNISVSLFGGTTPLVTAWLVETTGDPLMPAYYMMGAALIGTGAMLTVKETAGMPLRGSPPAVESRAEARQLLAEGHPVTVDRALPDITLPPMPVDVPQRCAPSPPNALRPDPR